MLSLSNSVSETTKTKKKREWLAAPFRKGKPGYLHTGPLKHRHARKFGLRIITQYPTLTAARALRLIKLALTLPSIAARLEVCEVCGRCGADKLKKPHAELAEQVLALVPLRQKRPRKARVKSANE